MTRYEAFAALVEELDLETRQVRQILALLGDERRELNEGQSVRLEAIAAEKMTALRALDLYAQRRNELLRAQGFAPGAEGLLACAAGAGPHGELLRERWNDLLEMARRARDSNAINGSLIRMRLSDLQGRLAALENASGGPGLYGADGLRRAALPYRPLGQV